ncbi:hypothetical protein, partial [Pseudomonas syringae group genomosp. 3]|uniref:hypothetical protein n=1 Tax=Pseudomonas syringae group genomosp. 3 TaxID=251701 RepID=UPI001C3F18B8
MAANLTLKGAGEHRECCYKKRAGARALLLRAAVRVRQNGTGTLTAAPFWSRSHNPSADAGTVHEQLNQHRSHPGARHPP